MEKQHDKSMKDLVQAMFGVGKYEAYKCNLSDEKYQQIVGLITKYGIPNEDFENELIGLDLGKGASLQLDISELCNGQLYYFPRSSDNWMKYDPEEKIADGSSMDCFTRSERTKRCAKAFPKIVDIVLKHYNK